MFCVEDQILNYRHVGIIVKNMEKSIDFYCNLLEHKIEVDFIEGGDYFSKLVGVKNSKARIVKAYGPGGIFVELIQFLTHEVIEPNSNAYNVRSKSHVCFTVRDIEKIYHRLKSHGVKFVSEPLHSTFDPAISCFCYDPDNTLVQLIQILDPDKMMVK